MFLGFFILIIAVAFYCEYKHFALKINLNFHIKRNYTTGYCYPINLLPLCKNSLASGPSLQMITFISILFTRIKVMLCTYSWCNLWINYICIYNHELFFLLCVCMVTQILCLMYRCILFERLFFCKLMFSHGIFLWQLLGIRLAFITPKYHIFAK